MLNSSSPSSSKESISVKQPAKKRRHSFSAAQTKKLKVDSDLDVDEIEDFQQEKEILFKMKALLDRKRK